MRCPPRLAPNEVPGMDARKAVARVIHWCSDKLATPLAIVVFPLLCGAWVWLGRSVDLLTLLLSVFSITMTQLILFSDRDRGTCDDVRDEIMHSKLDSLIRATDADRELEGAEPPRDPR